MTTRHICTPRVNEHLLQFTCIYIGFAISYSISSTKKFKYYIVLLLPINISGVVDQSGQEFSLNLKLNHLFSKSRISKIENSCRI